MVNHVVWIYVLLFTDTMTSLLKTTTTIIFICFWISYRGQVMRQMGVWPLLLD